MITNIFPDNESLWGGIFVKEQMEILLNAGYSVQLIKIEIDYNSFSFFPSYKIIDISEGKYDAHKIIVSKSVPFYNQFNFFLTTYKAIHKMFKQNTFQIIHCHYSYPCGIVGYLISKKWRVPYLITEHSFTRMLFRSKIHKRLALFAQKKAKKVIAVSEFLKKDILANIDIPVEIVPNVINENKFSIKPKTNLSPYYNIGFIGTLNGSGKGLDILLNALKQVKNINWHLHIGGNGTNFYDFKNMSIELGMENQCTFYGDIDFSDIPNFYHQLDLFILPSRFETFGIVVIEAMASGLPVIASRCGGPEDILTDETGILFKNENVEELTKSIQFFYSIKNRHNPDNARLYAINKFGKKAFLTTITKIYNSVLS